MKFDHIGMATTERRPGETYLAAAGLYVTDPSASPYLIEWLRFEPDSPMPEELKTKPHLAYEVDDLAAAMLGKRVLIPPFSPMPGVEVGFVVEDGLPIEFIRRH